MLEVSQLVTHYGNIEALHGVSLTVRQGEITALVGANGAGKTTLLRTISGLQRATAGTVTFEGRHIQRVAAERIAGLGIAHVPEGRHVFPDLSVEENLLMGAFRRRNKAEIKADVEQMYGRFPKLRERRRQLAGSMSGGEQQMLAISRALMSRPRLLLLDEPSMGLAPIIVEEIFRIIEEINESGTAILLVEQNATAALSVAKQAYVIETGRIVMAGPAADLAADPRVREAYLGGHVG